MVCFRAVSRDNERIRNEGGVVDGIVFGAYLDFRQGVKAAAILGRIAFHFPERVEDDDILPLGRTVFGGVRCQFALGVDDQCGTRALALVNAVMAAGDLRRDFIKDQQHERDAIAQRQAQTIRDSGREITKAWKYDRDALKDAHKAEQDARHQAAKERSKAIWARPQEATEAFNREVEQDNTRTRKEHRLERQKRERSRPRSRGRGRTLDEP